MPPADLINIKLRSGTADPPRAQDLAGVIGLIEANDLTSAFAARMKPDLRAEFRTLVRPIEERRGGVQSARGQTAAVAGQTSAEESPNTTGHGGG